MLSLQFAALLPTPFGNVEFIALKLVDALIEDTEKAFKYNNWCDLDSLGVIVSADEKSGQDENEYQSNNIHLSPCLALSFSLFIN